MLCQFTVENYKSIKDELTLDMQATAISEHEETIITDGDHEKFLPLAVIYGPNGSGKSNVLDALHKLISKIMRPICATCDNKRCLFISEKAPIVPFLFSDETSKLPTKFELFFRTKIAEYKYNLSVYNDKVFYESLYKKNVDGVKHSCLFIRDSNLDNPLELKGVFKQFQVSEITDTLTLLSYLAITYRKNPIIDDIIGWVENQIAIINYGNPYAEIKLAISKSSKIKQLILKIIKEMDIEIDDYRIDNRDDDNIEIYTKHIVNKQDRELKLAQESSGTVKLFNVLPLIANSLIRGSVLVVDELDAKLHPKLLKYIIELYSNKESNSKGAQLIFTSHDLSTMNHDQFRRDEIWFVVKDRKQSSHMYSLVEFKNDEGQSIRKDATFNKQYIEGKYGADPYLKKIINWEEYK